MRPDAVELIAWADRLDCRARLPELVRRLVNTTTAGIEEVDFPAGEEIQRPGVDGLVRTSEGSPFVPSGLSIWEMGCNANPRAKAEKDYTKRKESPPDGVIPAETSFVFVTPRRWQDSKKWVEEKRAEGFWGDVRAYNAGRLEQWLELSPPAASWLAQLLGRPANAQALTDFWEEWAAATVPATPETLLLAGREDAQRDCLAWLRGPSRALAVSVEDPGEAAAFVYATCRQTAGKTRDGLLDRAVVVRSEADLRSVSLGARPLTLVALDAPLEAARVAAAQGHHVLVAVDRDIRAERLKLPPLSRPRVSALLELAGVPEERAKALSRESNGSTAALRRLLGSTGPAVELDLAPLLLPGSWDERSDGDLEAARRITDLTEHDLQRLLRSNSVGPGALLRRTGTVWSWRSRLDAWRQLGQSLTQADLDRFASVSVEILTQPDPQFELPAEDRWLAAVRGKSPPHSGPLRKGLVEATVIMSVENLPEGLGPETAKKVVFEVLQSASTWEQLATLDSYLPTLAEAAPRVFLREIRRLVEKRGELIRGLRDSSTRAFPGWSDHLNGLVWALETLAWSPDYLDDVADILSSIVEHEAAAEQDDARAMRALAEIFLPWFPHTTAGQAARMTTVRSIGMRHPEVGYALLISMLPPIGGASSLGTHKPAWRRWLDDWSEGTTAAERHQTYRDVWGLVLDIAEAEPARWLSLLPNLHRLSGDVHLPRALAVLASLGPEDLDDALQFALWSQLRHELHHHRSVPDADWSMEPAQLQVLEDLYGRLAPEDAQRRFGWLFARSPELPELVGHDWRAEEEALKEARQQAASELLAAGGPEAITALAAEVEAPFSLGFATAQATSTETLAAVLERTSTSTADWAAQLRVGVVAGLRRPDAPPALEDLGLDRLPPEARADLARGLDFGAHTWAIVDSWGAEARQAYWSKVHAGLWEERDGELSRAVEELLTAGRPFDALQLMGQFHHRFKESANLLPSDIVRVLDACVAASNAGTARMNSMSTHYVGEMLSVIESAGSPWSDNLHVLEWKWFGALDHVREPRALYETLATDAEFFVLLLTWIFRGEGEEPRDEVSEEESARAQNAYRVLEKWSRLPGADGSGGVDAGHLESWVREVRRLAGEQGRGQIADLKIGEALALSPIGEDGHWPHEAVRDVIERLRATGDIQRGFTLKRRNQRGVFSKAIGEGGKQERALATSYRESAEALRRRWPVISRFLDEIADGYLSDAKGEDIRGDQAREAFIWAATLEDRLAAWVDGLQADGRYTFTLDEAVAALKRPEREITHAASTLAGAARIASPGEGFYVVVPLEYRKAGSPPASWFIDDWMGSTQTDYAVGLLTAASLHGAAHQQPQVFQVLLAEPREAVRIGSNRIEFIEDPGVALRPSVRLNTETGSMRVLSPEATTASLVRYSASCGGVDAVATILQDLGERLDADALAEAADALEESDRQRLGFILSSLGWGDRTTALAEAVASASPEPVWLRPDESGEPVADPELPWLVMTSRELDPDQ